MADGSPSLDRIYAELESLRVQMQSLIRSIDANNVSIQNRVTAVERDFSGHLALDEQKHEQLVDKDDRQEAEIRALGIQLGAELENVNEAARKRDAKVEELQKVHEQAKGAAFAWKLIIGLPALALVILNLWHLSGGGK